MNGGYSSQRTATAVAAGSHFFLSALEPDARGIIQDSVKNTNSWEIAAEALGPLFDGGAQGAEENRAFSAPGLKTVGAANFGSDVIEQSRKKPVLVVFGSSACQYCEDSIPLIKDLQSRNKMTLEIVTLDVDQPENAAIVAEYKVKGWPTFVLFKNGNEVDRVRGLLKEDLERMLPQYLPVPI